MIKYAPCYFFETLVFLREGLAPSHNSAKTLLIQRIGDILGTGEGPGMMSDMQTGKCRADATA